MILILVLRLAEVVVESLRVSFAETEYPVLHVTIHVLDCKWNGA